MALVERTPEDEDGYVQVAVTVQLDPEAHELLVELMGRTGFDASELVGWALGAYWREMEGIVLLPPPVETASHVERPEGDFRRHFTPQQVAAIERGLADAEAGRTISNEEMFAELRAEFGW